MGTIAMVVNAAYATYWPCSMATGEATYFPAIYRECESIPVNIARLLVLSRPCKSDQVQDGGNGVKMTLSKASFFVLPKESRCKGGKT